MMAQPLVTVCICTFKRPSIVAAVESVLAQTCDVSLYRIAVIDNDETPTARPLIDDLIVCTGRDITYVHAPMKNISIARNAGLKTAEGSRYIAFIDDDEIASPEWLGNLLASAPNTQAVVAPCYSIYRDDFPQWLRINDFHSNKIADGTDPVNGYTSNVLFDMDFVRKHALNFRLENGQTGGEDTIFFHQIRQNGGTIVYDKSAVVHEYVEPQRANFKWVARRKYRSGQTHGQIVTMFYPQQRRMLPFSSSAKLVYCLLQAGLNIFNEPRRIFWLARAWLHCGVLSYCVNPDVHKEYG